jgi:hypothetical protein
MKLLNYPLYPDFTLVLDIFFLSAFTLLQPTPSVFQNTNLDHCLSIFQDRRTAQRHDLANRRHH